MFCLLSLLQLRFQIFTHVAVCGKLGFNSFSLREIVFSQKEYKTLTPANESRRRMHNTKIYTSSFMEHQIARYTLPSLASFTYELTWLKRVLFLLNLSRVNNLLLFFGYAMESGTWLKSLAKTFQTDVWGVICNFYLSVT